MTCAQGPFLLKNLDVIGRVRRRRDEGEELGDEGRAADLVELVAVPQHLRERDEIDRLRGVPKLEQHREDAGVRGDVKALGGDAALDAEAAYLARARGGRNRGRPARRRGSVVITGEYPVNKSPSPAGRRPRDFQLLGPACQWRHWGHPL